MANNAVAAKARAVYGSMLSKDDYNVLTHKGTIPAAVAYLKTKPLYAGAFADTDEAAIHREQAEALINKNVFDNYLRVCRIASGDKKGIMSFYIRRLECEQLIKAIVAITSGEQEGFVVSLPEYAAEKFSFDALKLASAKTLSSAVSAIEGTIYYRHLYPLMTAADPDVDRILTTVTVCYIKWAFGQIDKTEKGKSRTALKDFFLRKNDADNLLMCLRLKSFGIGNDRIRELLIPYHKRIRPAEIDNALKLSDPVPVLRDMFIRERLIAEEISDIPEINVNAADRRFFRHRLAVCTNETEALYALTMLLAAESTDLCRIIEGLRYGLAPEEIEKYLTI